jgi:YgiT-type zinc finger domain-containing protein
MEKKCNFCGNINFREKKVQYIYRHDNNMLIINNAPCEECEYCGEQYFKADVLKKIENEFNKIHVSGKKVKESIVVPLEDFLEVA